MNDIHRNIKVWGSVLALLVVSALFFTPVSGDAPYYLPLARDISEGLVPYRDLTMSYTPVTMYLNAIIWKMAGTPPYMVFSLFQYLVILLSGILLYKISMGYGLAKSRAVFISIFLCIAILSSDGTYINLEVYDILFTLAAFLMLRRSQFFWCGFLLGITVFCKQYGIVNFLPFVLLIWADKSNRIQNMLLFGTGALVTAIIFFGYFAGLVHVPLSDLLLQLSGRAYGQQSVAAAKSFTGFLNGAKVLILMLLPLILFRPNPDRQRVQIILATGLLAAMVPVIVQQFQHYFLNAFPYAALLLVLSRKDREWSWPVVHLSLIAMSGLLALRIYTYSARATQQQQLAKELAHSYPKNSSIYLKGETNFLYVVNGYRNPALHEAGYSYIFKPDADFLKRFQVLTFDALSDAKPVRIITVNGRKIYDY